jgi:hypothetical protein
VKLLDKPERRLETCSIGRGRRPRRDARPAIDNAPSAGATICQHYMENTLSVALNLLLEKFVDYLNTLDEKAAGEILKTVRERVPHAP